MFKSWLCNHYLPMFCTEYIVANKLFHLNYWSEPISPAFLAFLPGRQKVERLINFQHFFRFFFCRPFLLNGIFFNEIHLKQKQQNTNWSKKRLLYLRELKSFHIRESKGIKNTHHHSKIKFIFSHNQLGQIRRTMESKFVRTVNYLWFFDCTHDAAI